MYLQTEMFRIKIKPNKIALTVGVEVDDGMLILRGYGWVRHQRIAPPKRTQFYHKNQMTFGFPERTK